MSLGLRTLGRAIVQYLEQPARGYEPFFPSNLDAVRRLLRPGDVLLIEGNSHLAGVIKYPHWADLRPWEHSRSRPVPDTVAGSAALAATMVALGSGGPTKFICSALIACAFQAVRYPILPKITELGSKAARREILAIRQSTLYMPRDFDISPYFAVVKPTIELGFDYKSLHWVDLPKFPASDYSLARGKIAAFDFIS